MRIHITIDLDRSLEDEYIENLLDIENYTNLRNEDNDFILIITGYNLKKIHTFLHTKQKEDQLQINETATLKLQTLQDQILALCNELNIKEVWLQKLSFTPSLMETLTDTIDQIAPKLLKIEFYSDKEYITYCELQKDVASALEQQPKLLTQILDNYFPFAPRIEDNEDAFDKFCEYISAESYIEKLIIDNQFMNAESISQFAKSYGENKETRINKIEFHNNVDFDNKSMFDFCKAIKDIFTEEYRTSRRSPGLYLLIQNERLGVNKFVLPNNACSVLAHALAENLPIVNLELSVAPKVFEAIEAPFEEPVDKIAISQEFSEMVKEAMRKAKNVNENENEKAKDEDKDKGLINHSHHCLKLLLDGMLKNENIIEFYLKMKLDKEHFKDINTFVRGNSNIRTLAFVSKMTKRSAKAILASLVYNTNLLSFHTLSETFSDNAELLLAANHAILKTLKANPFVSNQLFSAIKKLIESKEVLYKERIVSKFGASHKNPIALVMTPPSLRDLCLFRLNKWGVLNEHTINHEIHEVKEVNEVSENEASADEVSKNEASTPKKEPTENKENMANAERQLIVKTTDTNASNDHHDQLVSKVNTVLSYAPDLQQKVRKMFSSFSETAKNYLLSNTIIIAKDNEDDKKDYDELELISRIDYKNSK